MNENWGLLESYVGLVDVKRMGESLK